MLVHKVLCSPGQGLDAGTRNSMESRFGYDFGQVKIHTDSQSAKSARAINAQAYTVGRDVVFGAEQYAPATLQGQKLLAHELTHVIQQDGAAFQPGTPLQLASSDDAREQQAETAAHSNVGIFSSKNGTQTGYSVQSNKIMAPLIQRRLLVTGKSKDTKAFVELLEPASGLTLEHNPKTKEVSITASVLKPQSAVLAGQLATIISDPKQDAEIHLGHKQAGVQFGAFPSDAENIVQEVRIDQIIALEKGVPGAGVSTLAHEIVENYEAHALKDYNWSIAFDEAHGKAEKIEDLVAGELIGPGSSRNFFPTLVKNGKEQTVMSIDDRAQYFIVWEEGEKGGVVNARKVPRVRVSKQTISGFSKDTSSLPQGAAMTIKAVSDDLKKNSTASVLVEGFASIAATSKENDKLATEWAEMVKDLIIFLSDDLMVANWRKFHIVGSANKARNEVRITVDRPDI